MAAVLDLKGKQVGDLKLSENIFTKPASEQAVGTMHTALVRQLANARTGSASTKTRSEVRGGGAKPWRQKGTGRARAGSRRSPLWAGGGVIFGPKPRDYSSSMPVKMRHAAIKSALAAQAENLVLINNFADLKEIKTKEAAKVLQALKIDNKRVLFVVEPQNADAQRFGLSVRNMKNVTVVHANNIGVKELLNCEAILTSQGAIEFITKWLDAGKKAKAQEKQIESKAKVAKNAESTVADTKNKVTTEAVAKAGTKTATKEENKAKGAVSTAEEKAQIKSSALQSIATTSKSKNVETSANKIESTEKPKKANEDTQNKKN